MVAKKKYFIAQPGQDLEGGYTVYVSARMGTEKFWKQVDAAIAADIGFPVQIDKAIEVDDDCRWISRDICFR